MDKKEYYRNILPHFQQPGQAYFVTWCLKNSIPPKALERYAIQLEQLKQKIKDAKGYKIEQVVIDSFEKEYYILRKRYIKAYDDLLHTQTKLTVNLSTIECRNIIINALRFFEGKALENYAFCIMPNHVHWVFHTYEKNQSGLPVYLQDIMHSVKRHTASHINKLEKRTGVALWQKESFDTTIRNEKHLHRAIEYTINNPVVAGFVDRPEAWKGSWWFGCRSL